MPIGWLHATYHLLWEPGNSIEKHHLHLPFSQFIRRNLQSKTLLASRPKANSQDRLVGNTSNIEMISRLGVAGFNNMDVSKNRGKTLKMDGLKWKTIFFNGWFGGTPIFGNIHIKIIMLFSMILSIFAIFFLVQVYIFQKKNKKHIFFSKTRCFPKMWETTKGTLAR